MGIKTKRWFSEYQITIFDQPTERYRAIGVQYVNSFEKTLRNTYEKHQKRFIALQ